MFSMKFFLYTNIVDFLWNYQVVVAQWLARRLATGEVPGSNPGKGKNLLISDKKKIQARIAQLVAYRLGTGEVSGSSSSKGKNFSVKISNWIVQI